MNHGECLGNAVISSEAAAKMTCDSLNTKFNHCVDLINEEITKSANGRNHDNAIRSVVSLELPLDISKRIRDHYEGLGYEVRTSTHNPKYTGFDWSKKTKALMNTHE